MSKFTRKNKPRTAFGIIVLLVAVLLVGGVAQSKAKTYTDKAKIRKSERAALGTNKSQTDQRIQLLGQAGVAGSEISRIVINSCYVDEDDGGFVAMDYNEKCYLQTTVGLRVTEEPKTDLSNSLPGWISGVENCELAEDLGSGTTEVYFSGPQSPGCSTPDPTTPNFDVVAYAQSNLKSQIVSQTGPANDRSQSVVWVTHATEYWNENLGCKLPKLLSCDSPRSTPVMP